MCEDAPAQYHFSRKPDDATSKVRKHSPVRRRLNAFVERRVDVLEEDEATTGSVQKQMIQLIVHHPALREVQDGKVVVKARREGLNEGRFAAPRRAVQQISSSVWQS